MEGAVATLVERTKKRKVEKTLNLVQLASVAFEKCDGDVEDAVQYVIKEINSAPSKYESAIDEAILAGVTSVVSLQMRRRRAEIFYSTPKAPPPAKDVNVAKARVDIAKAAREMPMHKEMVLDFPLAGGLKLRDATKEQVLEAAARYRSQASDHTKKAKWLESIAALVKPNRLVGDCVDEKTAEKLRRNV